MPRRRYKRGELTPVQQVRNSTLLIQNDFYSGARPECWFAYSVNAAGEPDGRWYYEHIDMPGTPWGIGHHATRMELPFEVWSSLDAARYDTHHRPAELLLKIRANAQVIASGEQYLATSRERARAALPVLDAALAELGVTAAS